MPPSCGSCLIIVSYDGLADHDDQWPADHHLQKKCCSADGQLAQPQHFWLHAFKRDLAQKIQGFLRIIGLERKICFPILDFSLWHQAHPPLLWDWLRVFTRCTFDTDTSCTSCQWETLGDLSLRSPRVSHWHEGEEIIIIIIAIEFPFFP